ncbi:hypothetical protein [Bacteroides ilei]|uniref:hypothetical protein n=1 Tax=Bacteroides ilei TaxID=1907658 RepID=UPI000930CD49|nr:hypothetical protein [Bacteroides ilei]
MSDIIPILVFVLIAGLSVYQSYMKNQRKRVGKMSPRKPAEQHVPEGGEEVVLVRGQRVSGSDKESVALGPTVPGEKKMRKMPERPSREIQSVDDHKKIRLDSPSDARRAFIYSEIFNRKYE